MIDTKIGIKVELRRKAIRVAIAMTSGAYKTSLVSYFTHRDLFPSLMKVFISKVPELFTRDLT
jgi:hypothetical protein